MQVRQFVDGYFVDVGVIGQAAGGGGGPEAGGGGVTPGSARRERGKRKEGSVPQPPSTPLPLCPPPLPHASLRLRSPTRPLQ